jgi:hypothetical protein
MVTAIQRQHSRGALADSRKSDSLIGFETQKRFRNLVRITIFMIAMLLIRLGSLMICTHNLTILTQKKKKRSAIANRSNTVAKRSRQSFLSF